MSDNKNEEKISDNINPDHYKSQTSLECIDAMEIMFGSEAVYHFCLCNAFKYIWRWKNKNGDEDLGKAKWYTNRAKTEGFEEFEKVRQNIEKYINTNRLPFS